MIQIPAMALLDRVRRFVPAEVWLIVGVFALLLAFLTTAYFRGVDDQKGREAAKVAKAEARASTGRETAAVERVNDHAAIETRKQELENAVAPYPSTPPSPRRVALACERLRQQGAVLPEPCRPDR